MKETMGRPTITMVKFNKRDNGSSYYNNGKVLWKRLWRAWWIDDDIDGDGGRLSFQAGAGHEKVVNVGYDDVHYQCYLIIIITIIIIMIIMIKMILSWWYLQGQAMASTTLHPVEQSLLAARFRIISLIIMITFVILLFGIVIIGFGMMIFDLAD